ncbi:MAG: DUF2384 domain-containing protein [Chloroflexi bacterium]|nr:DUF2384 domain-containing protein [Chloroflexota bacterium]
MQARLEALADLDERLNELFVSWDAARAWMRESTRHLGDMAPMDAVRAGRIDRVVALIEAIDSGFASQRCWSTASRLQPRRSPHG